MAHCWSGFLAIILAFQGMVQSKPTAIEDSFSFNLLEALAVGNLSYPEKPAIELENDSIDTSELQNLEDDIVFDDAEINSGIIGEKHRWRNGLYVQIDRGFVKGTQEYNSINNGLYELHTTLCIDVILWNQEVTPSGDYVFIKRGQAGTGCWSYVGKQGGKQELNLQTPGCNSKGTVIHEAIHALGFHHEQSRPDRDSYVRIFFENISPGKEYNFGKSDGNTFNVPYDYTSIMHYGDKAFSKNGQKTIAAHNGAQIGSRGVMTSHDINKLKKMYNC